MESDWRLNGQEDYLQDAILYKVIFPAFWEKAYADKNAFYQDVLKCAKNHIKRFPDTKAYLEGDNIQYFWHEHCAFCWEKAMADNECEFYCTEDMRHWICKACFEDFKDTFRWTVRSVDKLFAKKG